LSLCNLMARPCHDLGLITRQNAKATILGASRRAARGNVWHAPTCRLSSRNWVALAPHRRCDSGPGRRVAQAMPDDIELISLLMCFICWQAHGVQSQAGTCGWQCLCVSRSTEREQCRIFRIAVTSYGADKQPSNYVSFAARNALRAVKNCTVRDCAVLHCTHRQGLSHLIIYTHY